MALDNANIARVRNEPQHAARYIAEAQEFAARIQELAAQHPAPARVAPAAVPANLPILRVEEAVARTHKVDTWRIGGHPRRYRRGQRRLAWTRQPGAAAPRSAAPGDPWRTASGSEPAGPAQLCFPVYRFQAGSLRWLW